MALTGVTEHALSKRDRINKSVGDKKEVEKLLSEKNDLISKQEEMERRIEVFFDKFDLSKSEIFDALSNKNSVKEKDTKDILLQALYSEIFEIM